VIRPIEVATTARDAVVAAETGEPAIETTWPRPGSSRAVPSAVSIEEVSDSAAENLFGQQEDCGQTVDHTATRSAAHPRPRDDGRAGVGRRRLTAHLHSAARTLEQILGELYPEHDWIVTFGEIERPDRHRDAAAPVVLDEAGPVADDSGPLADRHPPAPADRHDDHRLDEAA
jgi:hypothetical protein